MQSSQLSASVAFRAFVMLAFAVAISVVAFGGPGVPEKARQWLEKTWPAVSSAISKATASILAQLTPANTSQQNAVAGSSVPGQPGGGAPALPAQLTGDSQAILLPVQTAGSNAGPNVLAAANVVPADYQSPVDSRLNRASTAGQGDGNLFIAVQDRLRQLGATYYLLETWGNQRQFYRFYCQMAVGGNASYTRYFEAINANPMEAMADVLRQVEEWRLGGTALR